MKWASSFLISIAFHAAIFTLPVSLFKFRAGDDLVIPVVLFNFRAESGEGLLGENKVKGPRRKSNPSAGKKNPGQDQSGNEKTRFEEAIQTAGLIAEDPAESAGVTQTIVSFATNATATELKRHFAGTSLGDRGDEGGRGEFDGLGSSGTGDGSGGQRRGNGSRGLVFAQADYAHNPKPQYPERAQREGWEGAVFLRVLVNQEGRVERIEVGRSSGFATLDRAATKAVKDWRFHPARYGEKEVESWVRIPIVFKLEGNRQ